MIVAPGPPELARGRRGFGRLPQSRLGEIGGVRVPGGLAADHPHPGAPFPTGAQLLDLAVVVGRARRPPVLGEHLGEVASVDQGAMQGSRSGRTLRSRTTSEVLPAARDAYGTPVPLEPGLVGSAALTVCDSDTALYLGSGDVPVLATPRVVLLAERATVHAVEGNVQPRPHDGRLPGPARSPRAGASR